MKDFEEYRSKLPYGDRNSEERKAYQADAARLDALFRQDLFEDLGIVGHPKADLLFGVAWQKGHANGYADVYVEACDLVELIL